MNIKDFFTKKGAHRKILKGSSILFVMTIISSFIGYLIRIVLARSISPAEFGLFFSIFSLINFFYFFKDFGIKQAVAKYIPEFQVHKRPDKIKTIIISLISVQLMGSLVLAGIFYFASDFLAMHYFKTPAAAWLLRIMICYLVFSIIFKFYKAVFQGYQKMGLFSLIDPIKNLTIFGVILLFINNLGLKVLAIGFVISPLVVGILLFIPIMRIIPYKVKMCRDPKLIKQLFLFGLPVMVTAMGGEMIAYFDTLMLTYFRSLAEVGIYNIILPTANMVILASRSLATTVFPMISEYWAKKEYDKVKRGLKLFYKLSPLLIFPAILSWFLAKPFLRIFFGEAYVVGSTALGILFIGMFVYLIGMINYHTLAAVGHPKENAKIILSAALINVILNIFLIPPFGIIGAAIATTLAYTWVSIYSMIRIKKKVLNVTNDIIKI